jgi:hypothetical protein
MMRKRVEKNEIFSNLNCDTLDWTRHALLRLTQRNYSISEVAYVVSFGRLIYRNGRRFYFMAAKDIPLAHEANPLVSRLIGTTVLLAGMEDRIITVYKDLEGLHEIKKMPRFRKAGELNYRKQLQAA